MKSRQVEQLQGIKTLPQLLKFLRDELDWPIDPADVEDYTYDYTAEELGIEGKHLPKIKEIKQLRPLDSRQPWGIFWVNFEKKQLPVVVLRRILGGLVLKKRTDPKKSGRPAWHLNDLLFISSYGESEHRVVSFAHFAERPEGDDLPALKVLGWDDRDSKLHLDRVVQLMQEHLRWPDNPSDTKLWREKWGSAFTLRHREVITTSRELSIRLAELARSIRDRIRAVLDVETEKGRITSLMNAFREALIHDLDAEGFADMYAQTISYGLLSARITDPKSKSADDLALHMRTNPFLKELMSTFLKAGGRRGGKSSPGIDFDELGVGEVIDLLDNANMEAVVRDFGDKNPQEDPVIHFYEHFLAAYDKKQKVSRGVFYTPRPVVSYIVRSVDELLRTEFGLADGLADTTTWGEMAQRHKDIKIPKGVSPDQDFVKILDPATGTGTFLVEVIDLIHKTLVEKCKAEGYSENKIMELWNEYVPKHLLTRLHGYELLMAPYAIAHLKIGLKLYETGYQFGSNERARVYLTNALEPVQDFSDTFDFAIPALAHESEAVNDIKCKQRFSVVIGNPPYSKIGRNMSKWSQNFIKLNEINGVKIQSYYEVDGHPINERKVWLQDDYVKFLRLAQYLIQQANIGVYGYITNRGFLGNPTFNGMRQSIAKSFNQIYILDLHGDSNIGEETPNNIPDKNVFDIKQGVAISLGCCFHVIKKRSINFLDLWGARERKYNFLREHFNDKDYSGQEVTLNKPQYHFFPGDNNSTTKEFDDYWPLPEIMTQSSSGIVTSKDAFVIGYSKNELIEKIRFFINQKNSKKEITDVLNLSENYAWRIDEARIKLKKDKCVEKKIVPILYRPFDSRLIIYHNAIVWRTREPFMHQMLNMKNIALLATRQSGSKYTNIFCTRFIIEMKACSHDRNTELFPLWIKPASHVGNLFSHEGKQINLNEAFIKKMTQSMEVLIGDVETFQYIYCVLHSVGYRKRYNKQLSKRYPGIPLIKNKILFLELSRLGSELVPLHLLESQKVEHFITEYIGGRAPEVEKVTWSNNTVWVDKAQTIGFKGVREEVWNFHIGGYQVCNKWLKDRKGRKLLKADIEHYQKIVVALSETIKIMKIIDEVIEQHGGWPGAFVTGEKYEPKEGLGLEKVADKGKNPGKRKAGKKASDDPEDVVEDMF